MKRLRDICLTGLALMLLSLGLTAQETEKQPAENSPRDISRLLKKVIGRLDQVERELDSLKLKTADYRRVPGEIPEDPEKRQLYLQLEHPYLGTMALRNNQRFRFFAARLTCLNLTDEVINLSSGDLVLDVEGKEFPFETEPTKTRLPSFQSGGQSFQIKDLLLLKTLKIRPGWSASAWIMFTRLPVSRSIPDMTLLVKRKNAKQVELSINELSRRRLNLDVERVGPRQSLGLITVNGAVDGLSLGPLVKQVNQLAGQKVARFVIRFGESGSIPDAVVRNWLVRQAQSMGGGQRNQANSFPPFSASIRELHLAEMPSGTNSRSGSRSATVGVRVHKTTAGAVESALETVYETLPRAELIQEIQSGHPLTRVVAIKYGGGRLLDPQLPLLLELVDAEDPEMQKAALYALRHFNNEQAFGKLEEYVRKNIKGVSETAIDSLAASRFGEAHRRLLSILNNEPPGSKTEIVKILAQNPRPIWAETIYQFLDGETVDDYKIEAMRALNRIGHPRLVEVLKSALADNDTTIRKAAFSILVDRKDEKSEAIALKYTLEYMKNRFPTAQMHQLLVRTKSQAAIPLLLQKIGKSGSERRSLLKTLAAIGDERVVSQLTEIYPKLSGNEKAIVLESLWEMRSPAHRGLAQKALRSSDHSLIRVAVQTLTEEGSDESIGILIQAFEESTTRNSLSYLANALSQIKTAEARAALVKAREGGSRDKKRLAYQALRQIWQTSPGHQYVMRAHYEMEEENYQQAAKEYTTAIELDNELPTAFSGRGNAMLKLEKYTEAKADFRKALEYDSLDGMSITGLALVQVREGKHEAAFEWIRTREQHFKEGGGASAYFAYNTACVYGVAISMLKKDKTAGTPEEIEQKTGKYEQKTVEALKRSVKYGFEEYEWMRKDPDLESLHENEAFRSVSRWPEG